MVYWGFGEFYYEHAVAEQDVISWRNGFRSFSLSHADNTQRCSNARPTGSFRRLESVSRMF